MSKRYATAIGCLRRAISEIFQCNMIAWLIVSLRGGKYLVIHRNDKTE
ncbi:hypothetical protein BN133_2365 [Cronobacter dublinensis 582]|nr:hypothetical protein BN133_2365 [Cronobacter dublinensis 582]